MRHAQLGREQLKSEQPAVTALGADWRVSCMESSWAEWRAITMEAIASSRGLLGLPPLPPPRKCSLADIRRLRPRVKARPRKKKEPLNMAFASKRATLPASAELGGHAPGNPSQFGKRCR